MSKQDGVYTRTAAALEQKNSYGKRFAEVLKIADDARDKVASVESSLEEVKDRVAAAESEIKELPGKISLTVKNGSIGNTASIVLRVGDKEYPGTINLTGAVTFNDLKTSGKTNINGSNITTGTIKSKNYSYTSGDFATKGTAIDLEKGVIRSKAFAIDENGDANFKGVLTADTESKIGGWIATTIDLGYILSKDGSFSFYSGPALYDNTNASGGKGYAVGLSYTENNDVLADYQLTYLTPKGVIIKYSSYLQDDDQPYSESYRGVLWTDIYRSAQ